MATGYDSWLDRVGNGADALGGLPALPTDPSRILRSTLPDRSLRTLGGPDQGRRLASGLADLGMLPESTGRRLASVAQPDALGRSTFGLGAQSRQIVDLQSMREAAERQAQQQGTQNAWGTGQGGASGSLSTNGSTAYDSLFVAAAKEMGERYGVRLDPALLKAMAHIESGGTFNNNLSRDDGFGDGASVGMMQVKPAIWGSLVPDANPYDPAGNIRLGAAIMAQAIKQYGSWEAAITNVYFPVNDPNGTTQGKYLDMARDLMGQYAGPATGLNTTAAGSGGPGGGSGLGSSPFSSALWGGVAAPVTYEFGAPTVNGNMYNYGIAHGTNGMVHPAVDVGVPRGTPLYATRSGTVSCVGSADAGIGGTGGGSCGYFSDEQGGVGNVTIRFDDGSFLIYGHSMSTPLRPGQRVTPGQVVAYSGGLYGDHVHFEYRVPGNCSSGYCVADPRLGSSGGGTAGQGGTPYGSVYGGVPNWGSAGSALAGFANYARTRQMPF